jgi:hypothetical protein
MLNIIKRALNWYRVPKLDYQALAEDAVYTPDYPLLMLKEWQPLFVYDRVNYELKALRMDACQKWVAYTPKKFSMWMARKEDTVLVFDKEYENVPKAPLAHIKGVLYLLPPDAFKKIDRYKQNTIQCKRVMTNVIVPSRRLDEEGLNVSKKVRHYMYPAWIHVGINEYWDKHLNNYDHFPVERYTEHMKPIFKEYYEFTRLEHGKQSS